MVISGCPTRNGARHAEHIASMAIALASASVQFTVRDAYTLALVATALRSSLHNHEISI